MPDLIAAKHTINDERSVIRSSELLIDFIAATVQSLVDRKAKLEDFQEFATALRLTKQALATAVARNTAAESSGEAEPVPAEQPAEPEAVLHDEPEPAAPEPDRKEERRATVKSAAKALAAGYTIGRTVSAVKKRRK